MVVDQPNQMDHFLYSQVSRDIRGDRRQLQKYINILSLSVYCLKGKYAFIISMRSPEIFDVCRGYQNILKTRLRYLSEKNGLAKAKYEMSKAKKEFHMQQFKKNADMNFDKSM